MKKKSLILILFFLTLGAKSQDFKAILTSGKWYVNYIQETGNHPVKSDSKEDEWIVFLPNGKTEEEHFGDVFHSNWTYSAKNKSISLTGESQKVKNILEFTKDKLVVEVVERGQENIIVTFVK